MRILFKTWTHEQNRKEYCGPPTLWISTTLVIIWKLTIRHSKRRTERVINCVSRLIILRWRFTSMVPIPYHFLGLLIDLVKHIVAISWRRINYGPRSLSPYCQRKCIGYCSRRFAFYLYSSINWPRTAI